MLKVMARFRRYLFFKNARGVIVIRCHYYNRTPLKTEKSVGSTNERLYMVDGSKIIHASFIQNDATPDYMISQRIWYMQSDEYCKRRSHRLLSGSLAFCRVTVATLHIARASRRWVEEAARPWTISTISL